MMTTYTLAEELLVRYAGLPPAMRHLILEAAKRLKALDDQVTALTAERDAAMADIQRCCATCALCSRNNGTGEMCPYSFDCNQVDGDHWEWRGAKDTNVPSKDLPDTNVGNKEEG